MKKKRVAFLGRDVNAKQMQNLRECVMILFQFFT